MSNFWGRDDRIEEGTALRDLEKKVHFLMCQMSGSLTTRGGNNVDIPDDMSDDSNEVGNSLPTSL